MHSQDLDCTDISDEGNKSQEHETACFNLKVIHETEAVWREKVISNKKSTFKYARFFIVEISG